VRPYAKAEENEPIAANGINFKGAYISRLKRLVASDLHGVVFLASRLTIAQPSANRKCLPIFKKWCAALATPPGI
jgi:hypothetical protein